MQVKLASFEGRGIISSQGRGNATFFEFINREPWNSKPHEFWLPLYLQAADTP